MYYIFIAPIGEIEPMILLELQQGLIAAFGLPIEIMPDTANPSYAFEPIRKQYYSTKILENLMTIASAQAHKRTSVKVIGVTDVDLATPVLTFVFGEAQLTGCAAVVSITRLKQEFYQLLPNPRLLITRIIKEAIHELGHCFGLLHCDDSGCVMHYSSNITGIDRKSVNFCEKCLIILQNNRIL
jgi:archaemetzincin